MSDASRQRLIRAVRLLPGTVRVGHGTLEEIDEDGVAVTETSEEKPKSKENSALVSAEAELRMLRSELRSRESELAESRASLQAIRSKMESMRLDLDGEKTVFLAKSQMEAENAKAASSKEGRELGYASGYAEGLSSAEKSVRAEYEEKFSAALSMLSGIRNALDASREKLALGHAPQLVRLWEIMLSKFLLTKVELDSDSVQRVVENVLKRVSDRERISIFVNPSDVASVEEKKDDLMESIRGVKNFEILSDDHVDKGSCLIETNLGIYDARWRTQLEQVASEVQVLIMECFTTDGDEGTA